jgi:hypothetical protein
VRVRKREECGSGRGARRRRIGGRSHTSNCMSIIGSPIRGFTSPYSAGRPRRCEAIHGMVVEDIVVGGRCFLWGSRDTHFFLCGLEYGKSWSKCMIKSAIAVVLCYMLPCSGQLASWRWRWMPDNHASGVGCVQLEVSTANGDAHRPHNCGAAWL